ncbi:hypothetical protein [Proteus sp. FME41]|uniref:hypothetical protein n=1 Tax=Proteus sp. FME41 TaxID=2742608 RepID=UPI0018663643|nr:hypothetical protein [Proteus sp. FME41]
METVEELITVLEHVLPELDVQALHENLPESDTQEDILDWLYESLSAQGLMDYVEWKEYFGEIPDLKPLESLGDIFFFDSPNAAILSQMENIEWDRVTCDPYMLPYELPFLECINYYLADKNLRLVDLTPFENAYILCIHDNEEAIEKLESALSVFGIGLNKREPMDQEQAADHLNTVLYSDE